VDAGYSIVSSTLLKPPSDPEVLVISGIVSTTGEVTPGSAFDIDHGFLSAGDIGGNLEIRAVSASGSVENRLPINVSTTVLRTSSTSIPVSLDLGKMAFAVAMPITESTNKIEFAFGGITKNSQNLGALLLNGIVSSVPLEEYKLPPAGKCPKRSSAEMCNKVALDFQLSEQRAVIAMAGQIEKELNSKTPERAIPGLNVLVALLQSTTSKDYLVADGTELSQNEAVDQIRQLEQSVKKNHIGRCRWKRSRP
jgi:hypothetical protein